MIEDSEKYAAIGGWGLTRWLGDRQQPYGKDAAFVQECVGCLTKVRNRDFVFTAPVTLP